MLSNRRVSWTFQLVLIGVTLLFVGKLQAQATLPQGAIIELSPAADADSLLSMQNSSSKLYGQLSVLNSIRLSNPGLSLPDAIAQSQTGNLKAKLPTLIDETHVMVDAVATDGNVDDLRAKLEGLGLRNSEVFGTVISGEFPVVALDDATDIDTLNFMKAAVGRTQTGSVQSQAGLSMNAEGIIVDGDVLGGAGVKIGVLSDTYDRDTLAITSAADDIASGDLPPASRITILDDTVELGIDEGRAMMQLIHDVAPDADLSFHTALTGQAGFAQGIVDLADDGADIIVDDVSYLAEPFFQDGIIAQAVDQVDESGAAYFSSASNAGSNSYEGDYLDGGESAMYNGIRGLVKIHDIDPTTDGTQVHTFRALPFQFWTIVLQWDTPFASAGGVGANNDVDVIITDADFNIVFNASNIDNIGGDGFEFVSGIWTGQFPQEFALIIGVAEGSDGPLPGRLKFIDYDAQVEFSPALSDSTVVGHANAEGALAVGAAYYLDTPAFGTSPPLLEFFSSHGGTSVLLDTSGNPLSAPDDRMKPEFVAPDGVDNTFFGFDSDENGFPNFFGTSASAPNAAAAAALMLEAYPSVTPAQIESSLKSGAIDMNSAGFDNQSGAGLIDLGKSISEFEQLCEAPTGITPPDGSELATDSELLSWDNTDCEYWVYVGTATDGDAYDDSGSLGNANSYTLTGYPLDSSPVQVTLFYRPLAGGKWLSTILNYSTPGGVVCAAPTGITPVDDSILSPDSQVLSWDNTNCEYWVYVGTSAGDNSYANSGNLGTATSSVLSGYPADNSAVVVTLYYRSTTGGKWKNVVLNYVAPDGGGCSAPTGISPASGSTISADSQLLTWEDTGCTYWVYAGTEPRSKAYDDSGNLGTATSYSFTGYPAGSDVVVTLYYKPDSVGTWKFETLNYTVP